MLLSSPVSQVPLIGPSNAAKLAKLGIYSVRDLLYHLPRHYDDFSKISRILGIQIGETLTLQGQLISLQNIYTKNGKLIQKGELEDDSGKVAVIWFNQPFLTRAIPPQTPLYVSGKIGWWEKKPAMISPIYELKNTLSSSIHTGRLVPVYPETAGLSSKWLRSRINHVLFKETVEFTDLLPAEIITECHFNALKDALSAVHFPDTLKEAESARQRLAFEELFLLQLASLIRRSAWQSLPIRTQLFAQPEKVNSFIASLPFTLTTDQVQAVAEITSDLTREKPMNRLLEGDVGSGKTVVAAIAAYLVHLNGKKSIIMAPTQILANQHYETLTRLFSPLDIDIGLVTSESKENPDSPIIVGTHALLHQKQLETDSDISLIVIDEQQRFGVKQREHFLGNKMALPHLITMTATPIPRTTALVLYGDLDLSQINTMPVGRQKVATWLVPSEKRNKAYRWLEHQIQETHSQAFIVCPFIEPSESAVTVKSAIAEYERLKKDIFPDLKLGLLHGRLTNREKETVMEKFKAGDYHILVTTPVVEVGIDIANASVILIEDAYKFGLSQLHQLRGRVGRGDQKSFCLLFSPDEFSPRLKAMETTHSGPILAELDLKLRGPGDIYGTTQHGIPPLKIASYSDLDTVLGAKSWAQKIFPRLDHFPALKEQSAWDRIAPSN